jgi:hypothetical protein
MNEKQKEGLGDELVLTPGGFRPKHQVQRVGPDELVVADATGHHVAPKDVVLTPGGFRHPSLVHRLQPGEGVTRVGGVLHTLDLVTKTPTNALLDSAQNDILQPVLQWGSSHAGGGNFWSVTCWFVDSSGNAFYHDLVPVNEGDTLVGVLMLTGQSGGLFSYNCLFQGISGTALTMQNISQLVVATETLECYSIQQCSDYPNTNFTAMAAIDLKTVGGTLVAPGSALDGYEGSDGSQHVNFIGDDGHVHELYIDSMIFL